MCRGSNRHRYTLHVQAYGVESLPYFHRTYGAAARHFFRLNGRVRQPRLSRWYNGPHCGQTSYAKVMITRECKL